MQVATQLSFKAVLEACLADFNTRHCFVFEDDVMLNPLQQANQPVHELVAGAVDALQRHDPLWDIVWFGNCLSDCRDEHWVNESIGLRTANGTKCLHAFAVSRWAAAVIAGKLLPANHFTDNAVAELVQTEGLRGYRMTPEIFSQDRVGLASFDGNADSTLQQRQQHGRLLAYAECDAGPGLDQQGRQVKCREESLHEALHGSPVRGSDLGGTIVTILLAVIGMLLVGALCTIFVLLSNPQYLESLSGQSTGQTKAE